MCFSLVRFFRTIYCLMLSKGVLCDIENKLMTVLVDYFELEALLFELHIQHLLSDRRLELACLNVYPMG